MPLLNDWLAKAVKRQGGARALVYRDTYLSWRGLLHRVERRARELKQLGVVSGDWVGLMLGNVPESVILTLAADRIGAVAVLLDPATSMRDMDMILDAAPLRVLITRPLAETSGPLPTATPSRKTRVTPLALRSSDLALAGRKRPVPELRKRLSGTLLNCNVYARVERDAELADACVVHYTTDAGGDPKGVVRGDAHLAAVAKLLGAGLALEPGRLALLPTPFHTSYGFDLGIVAGLAHQLTMVLEDELSPKTLVRLLREEDIDYMVGTPALYGAIAQHQVFRPLEAPGTRLLCMYAPGSGKVAETYRSKWHVALHTIYHQAETGPVAFDAPGKTPQTVGTPLPGVSVRITAADGTSLPSGVRGMVWLRSPAVCTQAVPRAPVAIRAVGHVGVPIGRLDEAGFLRTGELGLIDHQGRLTILGREDDLVSLDGKRVALGEVEGCIESYANVRAAEARVIYDDVAGPMVVARVVTGQSCRPEDIIDHCARNLAPYKVPRAIEFCASLD